MTEAIGERPPFGAMARLGPEQLRAEQERTLASPRRRASWSAKALFAVMDLLYGAERTLPKFLSLIHI